MTDLVLDARQVSKRFYLRHNRTTDLKVRFLAMFHDRHRESVEEFWALRQVSLAIGRGEAVGIVGRNGSGKSTLLKIIAGLHTPTEGQMLVAQDARIGSMIELGVGFNSELTGEENVFLNASIYGLSRADIAALYPDIVRYSGLEHFMDTSLKNYSTGMRMRLGFAVAAHLSPDILLLDEIFTVGDFEFQQQCIETLLGFRERGTTILFVSHHAPSVERMCTRVCVLNQGRLQFDGSTRDGLAFYDDLLRDAAAG